jgi:alpha-tubulin suppressor-like RCC1 family protein
MEGYTEIFSWGLDNSGQLGLGSSSKDKKYVNPVFCSFNILIKDISCGSEHSGFISNLGHVYCMGSNSNGKLGTGNRLKLFSHSPCLLESISSCNAVKISCGSTHTAVVTSDGLLFTWGCGEYGGLGTGTYEDQWVPRQVISNAVEVSCGFRHMGVISNGSVFTCGSGDMGQLGTGKKLSESALTQIQLANPSQISCGVHHTGVVTLDGDVYVVGGNSSGQLGTGDKKSTSVPKKLNLPTGIKIICNTSSACITSDGVYIWGSSVFGENLTPKKIKISSYPITDIDLGENYGVGIDSNHNLFTWGDNYNGELATGNFEQVRSFYHVSSLKGKKIKKIAAGNHFVVCLGRNIRNSLKTKPERLNKDPLQPVNYQYNNFLLQPALKTVTEKPTLNYSRPRKENAVEPYVCYKPPCSETQIEKPCDPEAEEKIKNLIEENLKLKEDIIKLQKKEDCFRDCTEKQEEIDLLKQNYLNDIKKLKKQLEMQGDMQKDLEKDLETAIKRTNSLEDSLEIARNELNQKNFVASQENLKKIKILEHEVFNLNCLIEDSKANYNQALIKIEKITNENKILNEKNNQIESEMNKLHEYLQDTQKSINNLNSIIKQLETLNISLKAENSNIKSQILASELKNKSAVTEKVKVFKAKALKLLNTSALLNLKTGPHTTRDHSEAQVSNRRDLSYRQQEKIKNAVNKILENKDTESPLKANNLSTSSKISPENHSPYSLTPSTTPGKSKLESKISIVAQSRTRIEKKLKDLERDSEYDRYA